MVRVAAAALVILASTASLALAGAGHVINLSGGASPGQPTLVIFARVASWGDGGAVATWTQRDGDGAPVLMASVREPGGRWGAPSVLSPAGTAAQFPAVAVSARGEAVAVWQAGRAQGLTFTGNDVIDASVRLPGGGWSPAIPITPADQFSADPALAIDARGDATAVWSAGPHIGVATFDAGRGRWSASRVRSTDAGTARVAMDAAGDTVVAWSQHFRGSRLREQTATVVAVTKRAGRAVWGATRTVGTEAIPPLQASGTLDLVGPSLAISRRGAAILAWQAALPAKGPRLPRLPRTLANTYAIAVAVESRPNARWRQPQQVSGSPALWPQAAVTADDRAIVLWLGAHALMGSDRSLRHCCWSPPVTISGTRPRTVVAYPRLAVDAVGDALASWSTGMLETAVMRPWSDRWGRPTALGQATLEGGGSAASIDRTANATIIWPQQGAPVVLAQPGTKRYQLQTTHISATTTHL